MTKYLKQNTEYVKGCAQKSLTYRQISASFKQEFPEVNGGRKETFVRSV